MHIIYMHKYETNKENTQCTLQEATVKVCTDNGACNYQSFPNFFLGAGKYEVSESLADAKVCHA